MIGKITAVNGPQENKPYYDVMYIDQASLLFKMTSNSLRKMMENSMEDNLQGD